MSTVSLKISILILSEEVQSRVSLDEAVIEEYAEEMKKGDRFPPIDVYFDGEDYYVADGFHRVKAAIKAGFDEINARVHTGNVRDAILHSVGANASHGLRRTNLDKRNSVEKLLIDVEWQLWSDRKIADKCAVSHPFVAKVRVDLSGNDYQIQERTFERNGKAYTMDTTNIGVKKEAEPSNIIPSPVQFQKQEPVDDYDDEDEDDLDDLSIKEEDPGKIVVNPINWKERGNKFVEAMITASAFSKAIEIDSHGGFPDNMKEVFSEAILLMKKNLPQFIEYFVTTNSLERR